MYDASAFVGPWPFSSGIAETPGEVVAGLARAGIAAAALSPAGAVLAPEPMAANRALLAALRRDESGLSLLAVPIIDLRQPLWREHLAECVALGGDLVRAIKLVPNYHQYDLDDPVVTEGIVEVSRRRLGLAIQLRMADERAHHPLMKVPGVPVSAVAALAAAHPALPLLVCGAYMSELPALRAVPNVMVELSFVESGYLLRAALGHLGPERLLLGTHAPLHYPAAAVAKLASDTLPAATHELLARGNFARFFGAPVAMVGQNGKREVAR
jgi:hypothetical protein